MDSRRLVLAGRVHVRGAPLSGGGASSSTYLAMWLQLMESLDAVSYTHLTLPTSSYV